MRILKPLWLKHGGERKDLEVYSCHVSPDGLRLVTAAGDGYVRVWSTSAIYNGTDVEFTKPKQLAALSYHSGTIHAVRFSGNNKYLASGADDKIVCVYTLDPNPPTHTTFGSGEIPPVENWRIFRRLVGHENDVQDIGWSYDSSILVSVGLDSRVVVWSGYTFEKLKTLAHHGSHVKGITFDPANKYFATASDDRSIKIFRYTPPLPNSTAYDQTNNFTFEVTITQPFAMSPLTTYFRRCSWSPDGGHIAAANATNGPVSTAAIINRGSWDSEIHLIGHEGPIEVCCFSPRIFSKTPPSQTNGDDSARAGGVTVIACAGQDRALSIWNTSNPKPICISESLTMKSISDLAWAPDGQNLFITSLDGTIALASFAPGELGYAMPLEANEDSLQKYGAGRKVGIVEGTDGLVLEEKSKSDELRSVQGRMGELMGDGEGAGKSKTSLTNGLSSKASGPSKTSEKDPRAQTNGTSTPDPNATTNQSNGASTPKEDPNAARVERLKQRVTITKDGKKRVAPMLVSSAAGTTESSLPSAQLMTQNKEMTRNDAPQTILDLSKPFDGLPKGGLTSLLVGAKRKLAETGGEDDNAIRQRTESVARTGANSIMMNTTEGLTTATPSLAQSATASQPSLFNPALMLSQIRLAVPLLRAHIVRPLHPIATTDAANSNSENMASDSHVLEVRNSTTPAKTGRAQDREPSRITCTKRGQLLWQDYLQRPVVLVTGNSHFWAASDDSGSLYVWTPAGRRLFNAFALEAQVAILDCRGPYLLAITAVGVAHVWDVHAPRALAPPFSLAPVLDMAAQAQGPHLTNGPAIVFARLNSEGRILVAISNGDAYTFSNPLQVWQRLSEPWWAVGSQYWNASDSQAVTGTSSASTSALARAEKTASSRRNGDSEEDDTVNTENLSAGIIPLLERHTTAQTLLRGKAYFLQRLIKTLLTAEGYEGFETGVSIAHLENRLAAALTLGAKEEFKAYLGMYAKRLGAEGSRIKVEELLRSLLVGIYEDDDPAMSEGSELLREGSNVRMADARGDELCGWKKKTLLKEVVLTLGKFRDLQRVTVPYARLLGITEAAAATTNSIEDDDQMMT